LKSGASQSCGCIRRPSKKWGPSRRQRELGKARIRAAIGKRIDAERHLRSLTPALAWVAARLPARIRANTSIKGADHALSAAGAVLLPLSPRRFRELADWYAYQERWGYSRAALDAGALDAKLREILQQELAPELVETEFRRVRSL
jgi:hypothetical protein